MLKILVPATAALGLIAFAETTRSADLDRVTEPPASWHLSHDDEGAKLAYGMSNSDQLAMMATCAPGAQTVVVYGDVKPIAASLAAPTGPAMPDPLGGGEASEAVIPLAATGLHGLADEGSMTVRGHDITFQLAATRYERRVVDRFLAYCARTAA